MNKATVLYGMNKEDKKYRLFLDNNHQKIRLFKKIDQELVPLTVWTYDRLISEMMTHED